MPKLLTILLLVVYLLIHIFLNNNQECVLCFGLYFIILFYNVFFLRWTAQKYKKG